MVKWDLCLECKVGLISKNQSMLHTIKREGKPWLAQRLGASSHTPKGCGSIPGQGIYLGYEFDLQLGHKQEATEQCLFLVLMSLFLSLSPPPFLKSINISSGEDFFKKEGKKHIIISKDEEKYVTISKTLLLFQIEVLDMAIQ